MKKFDLKNEKNGEEKGGEKIHFFVRRRRVKKFGGHVAKNASDESK